MAINSILPPAVTQLSQPFRDIVDPADSIQTSGTEAILSARGVFYRVPLNSSSGPGIYAIEELNFTKVASFSEFPILITAIEFNQSDITSQIPCLENVKVFYSFGQNFGQAMISGDLLMGPLGSQEPHRGVEQIMNFFWTNRVSVSQKPISVSVAQRGYLVYLTGLKIMTINPEYHVMPFMFFGTLLDIARDSQTRVNPKSKIFTAGGIENSSLFKALTVSSVSPPDLPPVVGKTSNALPSPGTGLLPPPGTTGPLTTTPPPAAASASVTANRPVTSGEAVLVRRMLALDKGTPTALTEDEMTYAYLHQKIADASSPEERDALLTKYKNTQDYLSAQSANSYNTENQTGASALPVPTVSSTDAELLLDLKSSMVKEGFQVKSGRQTSSDIENARIAAERNPIFDPTNPDNPARPDRFRVPGITPPSGSPDPKLSFPLQIPPATGANAPPSIIIR